MLRVEKWVSRRTCLATIERWFSRANRFTNPPLRRCSHPSLAFAPGIVLRPLVNFKMPKMVPDQFVFEGAKCVLQISEIAPVNARKVDELRTAVAAPATHDVPLGGFPSLAKTVESVITSGACACDLERLQFPRASVHVFHNYSDSDRA